MTAQANFVCAGDFIDLQWRDDLFSGKPPTLYPVGAGELGQIELGPGRVLLLGGAPGAGKTAFAMQCVVDALRLTPALKAVVCNIEMPAGVLLDRQLARLSGVPLNTIRRRQLTAEHAGRIADGLAVLDEVSDRLAFTKPPFDLANVAASADAFGATMLCFDYIQRIRPPGDHGDKRGSVDATMDYLRQFADAGVAVLVVAAVSRSKDAKGRSTYDGDALNLASFRESSELEFGADDAFILAKDPDNENAVVLKHLKARHTEAKDIFLSFDRPCQRFTPTAQTPPDGPLRSALADLWNRTAPAGESDGEVW